MSPLALYSQFAGWYIQVENTALRAGVSPLLRVQGGNVPGSLHGWGVYPLWKGDSGLTPMSGYAGCDIVLERKILFLLVHESPRLESLGAC